jgi:hypothetical protein
VGDDRQNDDDRKVGDQEQKNALHGGISRCWPSSAHRHCTGGRDDPASVGIGPYFSRAWKIGEKS